MSAFTGSAWSGRDNASDNFARANYALDAPSQIHSSSFDQLGHDALGGDAGLRSGLAAQLVYAGLDLDIFLQVRGCLLLIN